jgi:hypothetical protein
LAPPLAFEFLKRRYASAIERADDRTASRLRAEIDRLISNPAAAQGIAGARSGEPAGPEWREPPDQHDDILGPHL